MITYLIIGTNSDSLFYLFNSEELFIKLAFIHIVRSGIMNIIVS